MIRKTRWVAALAVLAIVAASGSVQAQVGTKKFKINGSGVGPNGLPLPPSLGGAFSAPHTIVGNANFLGRHNGAGAVHTETADLSDLPNTGIITGTFGSAIPFVFTAANGDQLACDYGRSGAAYVGTYMLVPVSNNPMNWGPGQLYTAIFFADFVPLPAQSTGRFAGVTGSWLMIAVTQPFVLGSTDQLSYSWQGDGQLTFPSP